MSYNDDIYSVDGILYLRDNNGDRLIDTEDLERVISDAVCETKHEYFIKGYRVAHVVPCEDVTIEGVDLPLYKRHAASDAVYAAGCYCVKYEAGWKHGHGIMLSTLMKYEYRGPFHTLDLAYAELREIRKR